MNEYISPNYYPIKLSRFNKAAIILWIAIVGLVTVFMCIAGMIAFPLAWPFRKRNSPTNRDGWFMLNFPSWAWQWDNDYDGLVGQKNGKNYSKYPLGSFLGCFHWAALRNPANNWSRYFIGFDYNKCHSIMQDGNWWIARTDTGIFVRYKGFGWKIERYRHADRPWCGFGFRGDK